MPTREQLTAQAEADELARLQRELTAGNALNAGLARRLAQLSSDNETLRAEITMLKAHDFNAELITVRADNVALRARVAELEAELALSSENALAHENKSMREQLDNDYAAMTEGTAEIARLRARVAELEHELKVAMNTVRVEHEQRARVAELEKNQHLNLRDYLVLQVNFAKAIIASEKALIEALEEIESESTGVSVAQTPAPPSPKQPRGDEG